MEREFEARDLIEVMEEAVNYNRFLLDAVASWMGGARRVLDFGAGPGWLLSAIGCKSKTAIEVEPDATEQLRLAGVEVYSDPWEVGDETQDGIICYHAIEHLKDPLEGLLQIRRMLRRGAASAASRGAAWP